MNRVDYIKEALDINAVQAEMISGMLSDIPNDKIKTFLIFRMDYIQPMMSKELITKSALFDYKKKTIEARLRNGEQVFNDIYEVKNYLLTFYKGKEIVNGPASYLDSAIIAMNSEGEMINKFAQNEHGSYKKLNNDDTGAVLEWCLVNQHRIGDVRYVKYEEPKQLMLETIEHNNAVDNKKLLGNMNIKRIEG